MMGCGLDHAASVAGGTLDGLPERGVQTVLSDEGGALMADYAEDVKSGKSALESGGHHARRAHRGQARADLLFDRQGLVASSDRLLYSAG